MEATNIRVVQDAYAAFGRADMDALLACMTEDIRWQPAIGTAPGRPASRSTGGGSGSPGNGSRASARRSDSSIGR